MANMGAISVDIMANTRQFQRNMQNVQTTMQKTATKMKDLGKKMTLAITLPMLAVGAASLKGAMDLEATEAKYKTVFGSMTGEADKFIEKFKELTPITKSAARSMTSGIQDLLVPMGFLRNDATLLTGEFTNVIGALTNFNSAEFTAEQVAGKFQSAITGEYDSLKELGIQLSADEVKLKAVEMGLASSTKEVSKQAKVLVLIKEAYAQSGDALAAYNKENLDTLTKLSLLTVKLKDLGAELAVKLLPILTEVIKKVNGLVDRFQALSPSTQANILKIVALVTAIGPLLFIIGQVITTVGVLKGAFMALNPVYAGVAFSVGLLTAEFIRLRSESKKMRQDAQNLAKTMGSLVISAGIRLNPIGKRVQGLVDNITSNVYMPENDSIIDFADETSTDFLDDLIDRLQVVGDVGESAFDKLNDSTRGYIDTLKSQIDTFKQAFGIFSKPDIEKISGERLYIRMQAQTKIFEKWQKGLDTLRNKLGANSKLFQQVAAQGAGATGQVLGLAGLSSERLAQLEAGIATRGNISTSVATGLMSQQISADQKAPTVNLNGGVYVGDMAELANLISRELKLSGVN